INVNNDLKTIISNNLYISENEHLLIDNILEMGFDENSQFQISLNSDYLKYSIEQNQNILLSDNILTIQNLIYYETINISNLEEVYNYLQTLIINSKYTPDDLKNYINSNKTLIKKELSSRMVISDLQTLETNEIIDVTVNSTKLEITLNSNNKKYNINPTNNFSLKANVISISNLEFFTNIRFSNLSRVHSEIQNIITNNGYTANDFTVYVQNNKSIIKNTIINYLSVSVNGSGKWNSNQIADVDCSNGTINIRLQPPANYKYSIESYSNASLSNNLLRISNFSYYSPTPSSYFNWNGSVITGLSSSGANLTTIRIPNSCTGIGESAFDGNKKITYVEIPGSVRYVGVRGFNDCRKLSTVILHDGLEYIDQWGFWTTESIYSITLPSTLTLIKYRAFRYSKINYIYCYSNRIRLDDGCFASCFDLKGIWFYNIYNSSNLSIDYYTFSSSSNNVIYVRNNDVKRAIDGWKILNGRTVIM
ncbi:MAG: leucine-rich repeat domain-containing protein, partial [Ureaplasma sp.]|nr:leucine-rich repeat domain-containing protein [Ureaplasma sp.]